MPIHGIDVYFKSLLERSRKLKGESYMIQGCRWSLAGPTLSDPPNNEW